MSSSSTVEAPERGSSSARTFGLAADTGSIWRTLSWTLLCAIAVRMLVVVLLYRTQVNPNRDFFHFGWETGRVARSLALGHGFSSPLHGETGPTICLAPLYAYILAAIFKVFGIYSYASAFVALTFNSVCSSLTCIPVFFVARQTFSEKIARYAAWGWAFYPYAIDFSAERVWGDTLNALLVCWVFLLALQLSERASWKRWLLFGFVSGVAALASTAILAIVTALGMWIAVRQTRRGQSWFRGALLAGLTCTATVSPWLIRNYVVCRQVTIRNNFWVEVRMGNTGDTSDVLPDWAHPSTNPTEMQQYRQLGEMAYNAAKKRQALEFIRRYPGYFGWLCLRRAIYFWTGFWTLAPAYRAMEPMELPNMFLSTVMLVLLVAGLSRAYREGNSLAPAYTMLIAIFPLVYYVTHPTMDYRHPIDPEIVILATYALAGRNQPSKTTILSGT